MKNPLLLLLACSLLVSATGQEYIEPFDENEPFEGESESRFFGALSSVVTFPDGNDWEYSAGIEGRAGILLGRGLRIYGLLGYSVWESENDAWIADGFETASVTGEAGVFSVGGGVEYLVELNDIHSLSFGANYQYQFVDGDIRYDYTEPFFIEQQTTSVHIGDASALYAGIDYFFNVNDRLNFSFGLGYLFNLTTADVSFQGQQENNTKFEGFTLRLGVGF